MTTSSSLIQSIPELAELVATLRSMSPEEIVGLAAIVVLTYVFTCFAAKAMLLRLLRAFGLYSPPVYAALPSALPYWRSVYRLKMQVARWKETVFRFGKYATAGFAGTLATMTQLYTPSTVLIGRVYWAGFGLIQPVGARIQRHIMVYAMTGAGKTTWIITMLALWRGSACIVDPKGQITNALAQADKREWIVFRPHEPERSAQWNPLDDIKAAMQREGHDSAVKWAQRLSESLIVTPAQTKTPFFADTARGYLTGLILHVLSAHEDDCHSLLFVYELAVHGYRVFNNDGTIESTPKEARQILDKELLENPAFQGAVSSSTSAFINASGDTKGSLVATLLEQLKWMALPSVKFLLSATTRPLSDAKSRDDVVFAFVTPVLSLREELKPLFRVYTNFVSYTFESVPKKKGQCLFVIDEVQAMGHNATLEVALPVARSYGLSVVAIAQDREGMKAAYPKTYGSFEGNADVVLFMATNHPDNYNYVSQALGKRTHIDIDPRSGKKSYRESDVMTPDQVKRFLSPDTGNLIAIRAGARALRLKIAPYFSELPVTSYAPDPDHREPIFRRISRLIFNPKSLFKR
ncbi:type IV secretory system conjugative DNA transfer family protein [Oceanobacter antarcticus]|uniref:Type IV secretory system conjugative DNA transfer family protein n=1 Tax=Oceanobacter antarcticus TaxID=3133425 RepID=A0ABW8NJS1_9GAMM